MSIRTEEEQCVVCHAYLFSDDDVVYCPECGAPHHRDCYNGIGHCGLEEYHGTDKQYDKAKTAKDNEKKEKEPIKEEYTHRGHKTNVRCNMCGAEYDSSYNVCPNCSAPNMASVHGFPPFDFLGGVPADLDIGDGVTADEAKRFVMANTTRYIPKFAAMKIGKRVSWNWLAFLFPCGWFLSRKMYFGGILVGILTILLTILQFPFVLAMNGFGIIENATYLDVVNTVLSNIDKIGNMVILLLIIGVVLDLVLRVVCALFGDYFYRNYTISSIKKMRAESEDMDADYRKLGGVNLWAMMLGFFAVQQIPNIIFVLI